MTRGSQTPVSAGLLASYRDALDGQMRRTLARRIGVKVRDARKDVERAGARWPFELLQNAHDAHPREGRSGIRVSFDWSGDKVRVSHDAAPFDVADLAALMTGGSSKDFDSEETTGRFGTGFLVTHVLSETVVVDGIAATDGGMQKFRVELQRPADDEAAIEQNVTDSELQLQHTTPVDSIDGIASASFSYVVDRPAAAERGFASLRAALPYLFGSCRRLDRIEIRREGQLETWAAKHSAVLDHAGCHLQEISVTQVAEDGELEWRVFVAAETANAAGELLVAVRRIEHGWEVHDPGELPRVFRQFPVIGFPRLPMHVIANGAFDVNQERSTIHVDSELGAPVEVALKALPALAAFAYEQGWSDAHRVARLASPPTSLLDSEAAFWRGALSQTAKAVAVLPLIPTVRRGLLPATTVGDGWFADFLSIESPNDAAQLDELWSLGNQCTALALPARETTPSWSEVAMGWAQLGVDLELRTLSDVGKFAKGNANHIDDIEVEGDKYQWLAAYLEAVGARWRRTETVRRDDVAGLLPNQRGELSEPEGLSVDDGIGQELKTIAESVGVDFLSLLVDLRLMKTIAQLGLENAAYVVRETTRDAIDERAALERTITALERSLPEEVSVSAEDLKSAEAAIRLHWYLWSSQADGAKELAWRVPLLASDQTARRAGLRRMMMLPTTLWPERAQPFSRAYPAGRILAASYIDVLGQDSEALAEGFASWGICHPSPLIEGKRDSLKGKDLRAIAATPDSVEHAELKGAEFAQVALLQPEVINHSKRTRADAQALLGLVVCYVARADDTWRTHRAVSLRTPDGELVADVTPSLWLVDLLTKQWIPVEENDETTHHPPNRELVRDLLDPLWLVNNPDGVDLLVQHFGMDALEVRLIGAAPAEEERQALRDGLARIVEIVGGEREAIEQLAATAGRKQREVNRMRAIGLAVQKATRRVLESKELDVEEVDRGYDYKVTPIEVVGGDDPEDSTVRFSVDEYLVEIKTTTTVEVRLTPLQAETAATLPERFVLCVVDLRDFDGDIDTTDWDTCDVSDWLRFVPGGELAVAATLQLVNSAGQEEIPLRNAHSLRYAVRADLWADGMTLEGWLASIRGSDEDES